jgi:hypothetical protein
MCLQIKRFCEKVKLCDVMCVSKRQRRRMQKGEKKAFQQIDGNKHNWLKIHGAQRAG